MVSWNYSTDFIYHNTFNNSVNIYLWIWEESLTWKCGQIIVHDMDRNPENIGRPKKWNWEEIKSHYMAGLDVADITKLPQYKGLSPFYFRNVMVREKWAKQRDLIRTQASAKIEKKLIHKMGEESEAHLWFMLKQLEEERKVIEERKKLKGTKEQKERLELLTELDKTARRTLGLDQQEVQNQKAMSVNAMISLHVTPPIKDEMSFVEGKHNIQILEGETRPVNSIVNENEEQEEEELIGS